MNYPMQGSCTLIPHCAGNECSKWYHFVEEISILKLKYFMSNSTLATEVSRNVDCFIRLDRKGTCTRPLICNSCGSRQYHKKFNMAGYETFFFYLMLQSIISGEHELQVFWGAHSNDKI